MHAWILNCTQLHFILYIPVTLYPWLTLEAFKVRMLMLDEWHGLGGNNGLMVEVRCLGRILMSTLLVKVHRSRSIFLALHMRWYVFRSRMLKFGLGDKSGMLRCLGMSTLRVLHRSRSCQSIFLSLHMRLHRWDIFRIRNRMRKFYMLFAIIQPRHWWFGVNACTCHL